MKDTVQYVRITLQASPNFGKIYPVGKKNYSGHYPFTLNNYESVIHSENCELVSISINPQKEQETDGATIMTEIVEGSYDLNQAARKFAEPYTRYSPFTPTEICDAFLAGAEWQKQQVQDKGFCISDEQLEKLSDLLCKGAPASALTWLKEWFPSASCFKAPVTYSVGQRFEKEGEEWILCTNECGMVLISLESGDPYSTSVKVKNRTAITEAEFSLITFHNPEYFTLIQPES